MNQAPNPHIPLLDNIHRRRDWTTSSSHLQQQQRRQDSVIVPRVEHLRDRSSAPLYLLTCKIVDTYRRINTNYYAQLAREAAEAEAAAAAAAAKAKTVSEPQADASCDYVIKPKELLDEGGRYEITRLVGKGSFGQVAEAFDKNTNGTVAIKILKNKKSFHSQGMLEIRILEFMNARDPLDGHCIVRLNRHFEHQGHLCLVYELLSNNLYEMLRSVRFAGVSLNLIRKFASQILVALRFLSRPDIQIIHCDLKPENILLRDRKKCALKVIDFGSSCFHNEKMYTYIQSRFYRAPEVILGAPLSFGIDMWSLGCLLIELFTGEPLFAGQNEHDQMCRMCDVLGVPPLHVLESGSPEKIVRFFTVDNNNHHRIIPNKLYKPLGRSLSEIIAGKIKSSSFSPFAHKDSTTKTDHRHFKDLVERMLIYDPKTRITPGDAYYHPFFTPRRNEGVNTRLTSKPSHMSSISIAQTTSYPADGQNLSLYYDRLTGVGTSSAGGMIGFAGLPGRQNSDIVLPGARSGKPYESDIVPYRSAWRKHEDVDGG